MSSELTGHLLVAIPQLEDPNFSRTVVLLIRHAEEEGGMGLILNRPLNLNVQQVWESVSKEPLPHQQPAYWGGPVQGPLVVVHRQLQHADLVVEPDLYVSTQRENVEKIVRNSQQPFRFYLGYSGWGKGQLESETAEGGWYVLPPDSNLAFSDPYDMWKHCCAQVGNQVLHCDQRLRSFTGKSPDLN